jgi:hypothetical protein
MYIPPPVSAVETAFYSCKSALHVVGRSATGRADLINSKRVLADIKHLRAALDTLEAACAADLTNRRAAVIANRASVKLSKQRELRYIDRHPVEIPRAVSLGIIPNTYAADGLVAMLMAERAPEKPVSPVIRLVKGLRRVA